MSERINDEEESQSNRKNEKHIEELGYIFIDMNKHTW